MTTQKISYEWYRNGLKLFLHYWAIICHSVSNYTKISHFPQIGDKIRHFWLLCISQVLPYALEQTDCGLFTFHIFKTRFWTFKLQKRIQNLNQPQLNFLNIGISVVLMNPKIWIGQLKVSISKIYLWEVGLFKRGLFARVR